ncbi:MAG: bactofilin family protein [Bacillota bacterium]
MFKKNETIISEKIDTLIGKNSSFEGILHADGTVRIDGQFKGEIHIKGDLIVGEEGKITGNVHANNTVVSGTVIGNINVSNQLRINSNGKVLGDVDVFSLIVQEKAIFDGKCKMQNADATDNILNIKEKHQKTAKA